ncbi:uncharacterized protein mslnb [Megalops cyprinoides]|uniref:uncharacterized protein mslnb n=1 Tax=Megalops cyprinoides TaxID=118141 RepID=UPI00186503D4|nr:uncharacterized protein mslnb [Megalops cyprinoides]
MRHRLHFLLLYLAAIGFGCLKNSVSAQCVTTDANGSECSSANSPNNGNYTNGMCNTSIAQHACYTSANSTVNNFIQCAGLSVTMSENSLEHMRNLKGVIDAALDLYAFMRSTFSQAPILELSGGISLNTEAEQFHDLDFVKLWFQVKLRPLLSSVSRQFLSCLSTKNFSCETYQAVVKELSLHFSNMDPVRQRWIYMFFMYPFLAGNGAAGKGCISPEDNSEDWLMKNFGSFSAMASFKDFTTLNIVFDGLEVLHLLTPEQKAELILHPEIGGLDNGTISLVFESLLKPLLENQHLNVSQAVYDMTTPAPNYYTTTMEPSHYMTTQQHNGFQKVFNGFLMFFKPLGNFVKEFVSLTQQKNLTSIKSTTLTQAVLNWTLAELAGHFTQNITVGNETRPNQTPSLENFDITNIDDWFQHVVVPVLKRFLPHNQTEIPKDLTAVFYHVFSLNSDMNSDNTGPPDICSVTIGDQSCSIPNAVESLAHVLRCVAHTNLSFTEQNLRMLVIELSQTLSSLVEQYSALNFSTVESHIMDVFGQLQTDFTTENLDDVDFIRLWFQTKLKPLLPTVSQEFLSCLSTKNFTCETYQVLVMELNDHISLMDEIRQQSVYSHFIYPFLSRLNTSDSGCISSTNSSTDWLKKNFGKFSIFAPLQHFYDLYSNFSGVEALAVLSPRQTAELVVLPLPEPLEKDVIINKVFDHLLVSPEERNFMEFLHYLIMFTKETMISCESYKTIFRRLYEALPTVSLHLETVIQASIDELMQTAPGDCMPEEIGCSFTPLNDTRICTGVNSTELQQYLDTGNMVNMLCHFSIEQYACSPLMGFTAENLVTLLKCKLPSNVTSSKGIWKAFLTEVSGVLDEALNNFSNMSIGIDSPSVSHVLDVVGEIRIDRFSNEQLRDVDFINTWFRGYLRPFLSSASGQFLHCLSSKNFSCETYQHVVKEFSYQFPYMDQMRQHMVYKYFIHPFLSQNTSDPACISTTNGSVDWLQKNFGQFSVIVPLNDLLDLNHDFTPLEALALLSPKQTAELVVLPLTGPPEKNLIINTVFDHFLESPKKRNFMEFLHYLVMFSTQTMISCDSYKTIFGRLYQALPSVPRDLEPVIWASIDRLMQNAPGDCIPEDLGCLFTPLNETRICADVNSTELQHYLDTGVMTNMLCHFTIEQYACSSLMEFTAENLITLLKCKLPSNMIYSKGIWKVFLTKVSGVLDEALNDLSNMSLSINSPSVSHILDILGEIRIDRFSDEQLRDVDFINTWFHGYLRPFLHSASGDFLHCLSSKNFSCETYQHVVKEFSYQFPHMDQMTQHMVYKYFIHPFLSQNASDPACISSTNSSVDWLHKNFGQFSVIVPLSDLLDLNHDFTPLEALPLLSPKQTAELVVLPLTGPPQKNLIINTVFNHLLESPKERNLMEFLHYLVTFSTETMISCDSYKTIFRRLYLALPSVPRDLEPVIWASIDRLMQTAPGDCKPEDIGCLFTPNNETRVCAEVNSTDLQHYLDNGNMTDMLCYFSIEQYACSSLMQLTAENLVALFKCKLPSNMTYSKETWKVFLTKASGVLDETLNNFSNMTFGIDSPSVSDVLDVLGEIRIDRFSNEQLRDVDFINTWFHGYLRPFLSSASGQFLHCLSSKNFSCETYQQVVKEFSYQFLHMDQMRQQMVYKYFIQPFLSQNTSDPACISSTNGSMDWLHKNFGQFSIIVPLSDLLDLNHHFASLEALPLLSPKQTAELVVLPLPGLPEKNLIINTVFDHLLESPKDRNLMEFLHYLVMFSTETMISCDSYKTIFRRLYQALPSVPRDLEPVIWVSIDRLMQTAPGDCIPEDIGCLLTPHNETRACTGINSTELQQYLDTGNMANMLCDFSIEQYACSQLTQFTAENLITLLKCKLPSNMTYSKETWKVFLTKVSGVLDEALNNLSNMTFGIYSPSVSHVLDILGEIRIDRFSNEQLRDVDFINTWFHGYLRPFLSSASGQFLHCLSRKNFSCETYQHVMKEFSYQFPHMDQMRQHLVYKYFIQPFLSQNTSDPACISSTSGSRDWLHKNFGQFSLIVPLKDLLTINKDFAPLEALPLLSPKQTAELVVLPLPGLLEKNLIINTVFDRLLESPKERNLMEFLHYLVMFSTETMISCDSYKTIFRRLYQALPSVPRDLEPAIWASIDRLMQTAPGDCMPENTGCSQTPHNETRVCAGVSSTELQYYLDTGDINTMLCDFSIEQYACSSLVQLTAENLITLLKCKLPSNMTYSKETWKVFLTKVSGVLDEALNNFSNMTFGVDIPSVSQVLDVLGEIRIDRFSNEQLRDVDFINTWFHGYLRPFLSSASGEFLHCLSSKNFSCETYQHVVKEFSYQLPDMDQMRQVLVYKYFIYPFLSKNTSDPACVSSSSGSTDWLNKNFGQFSVIVPLSDLLTINKDFTPLEALALLSPKQTAELVVLPLTGPPQKNLIINTVFDYLLESPEERNLMEFLHYLVMLSAKANIGCGSYKTIFNRLQQALSSVPTTLVFTVISSTESLMQIAPPDCMPVVFSGECDVTPVNETKICAGVDSATLQSKIRDGSIAGMICSFSIEEYACSSVIGLTANHLVMLLKCNLQSNVSFSKETWKLFLSKVSGILDESLDLYSNMTASSSNPSTSHILDVIGEIRIDSFSTVQLRDINFIKQWFQIKLNPFLPSVSKEFLSCLSTKNFSCETFQAVVEILGHHYTAMDRQHQILVYTDFIDIFLSQNNTSDPGCVSTTHGSAEWLGRNFGKFASFASFMDFQRLYRNFAVMDALSVLTVNQLAEVASTPEQLKVPEDVNKLMSHVPDTNLAGFFDIFSPAIQGHESQFPYLVRGTMLQQVFDRGNLSDPSVSDAVVLVWLQNRLRPLLPNLSRNHVAPYFNIVRQRQCTTSQQAVELLNSILPTLHSDTQSDIYSNIVTSLKEPAPLRCYTNGSFYVFLKNSFLGFQFPDLTTFLSLMPQSQKSGLINSIPPSDLGDFLRRPNVVDNNAGVCTIFNNYNKAPDFLEAEDVPDDVRRPILPCVWPSALSTDNAAEVDLWFDKRLKLYLKFLTKELISFTQVQNAKCLPFRKMVSVLGDNYSYNSDFDRRDVYDTIKMYLSTGAKPKCYNAADPQLNSTAWFVSYISVFITFITLDDLNTFGSAQQLQVFSTNLDNLQLFNHSNIPQNVSSFYTELVYLQDPNFNPLLLPLLFRCGAPGLAFTQLNEDESMVVLHNLTQSCSDLDPQVSMKGKHRINPLDNT